MLSMSIIVFFIQIVYVFSCCYAQNESVERSVSKELLLYGILRYIRPTLFDNRTILAEEDLHEQGDAILLKVFLGAKVEYVVSPFGSDDTFYGRMLTCHSFNSSDDVSLDSPEPYLMVLPMPNGLTEDASQILLTVYGVQYISIQNRIFQYVMKKKAIHDLERKITMDIHMEEDSQLIDDDAWMQTKDGLEMQRILKETRGTLDCCDGANCRPVMRFYCEKSPQGCKTTNTEGTSWVQHRATAWVLSVTVLYFYARIVVWLYVMSQRGKDISPSKGWVRDDQQGRLCRTS